MENNKELRCPNCGTIVTGNFSYCGVCGSSLKGLSERGTLDDNAVKENEVLQYFERIVHQHYELKAENPDKGVFTSFFNQDILNIFESEDIAIGSCFDNNILINALHLEGFEEEQFLKLKCLQLNIHEIYKDENGRVCGVDISLGDDYMKAAKIVYDVFKTLSLSTTVYYTTSLRVKEHPARFKFIYSTVRPDIVGKYSISWWEANKGNIASVCWAVFVFMIIVACVFYFVVNLS